VSPGKLLLVAVGGLLVVFFFVPVVRDVFAPFFVVSTETITIPAPPSGDTGEAGEREVILVTLLGYDAIPSIMDTEFVNASQAELWMKPNEQVLGLSINGDHRAYSINMLSRHEIVNDVVGGLPVAVTW
jgi:hypothetical protein